MVSGCTAMMNGACHQGSVAFPLTREDCVSHSRRSLEFCSTNRFVVARCAPSTGWILCDPVHAVMSQNGTTDRLVVNDADIRRRDVSPTVTSVWSTTTSIERSYGHELHQHQGWRKYLLQGLGTAQCAAFGFSPRLASDCRRVG